MPATPRPPDPDPSGPDEPIPDEPGSVNQNVARGAATRRHLLEVATGLFAQLGYEDTSIEAVLRAAEVSRGSLYHHFAGKDALFEAVLEDMETSITQRMIELEAGDPDPRSVLRRGCEAWINLAGDPVVRQVLLIDAPSVLGWARWRDLEERYALGLIKGLIAMMADDGLVDPSMVDTFSHVVLASINEIALMIALADDPAQAQVEGAAAVDEVLSRLLG